MDRCRLVTGIRGQGEIGFRRGEHGHRHHGSAEAGRRHGREDLDGGVIRAGAAVDVARLGGDVAERDEPVHHGDGDREGPVSIGEVKTQVIRRQRGVRGPSHCFELEGCARAEGGDVTGGGHRGWCGHEDLLGGRVNAAVVLCVEGDGVAARCGEAQGVELTAVAVAIPVDPIGRVRAASDVGGAAEVPFLGPHGPIAGHIVATRCRAAIRTGGIAHHRLIVRPADDLVVHIDVGLILVPGEERVGQGGLLVPRSHNAATGDEGCCGAPNRAEVGVGQGQRVVAVPGGAIARRVGVRGAQDPVDLVSGAGGEPEGVVLGVIEHLLHGEGIRRRPVAPIEAEAPGGGEGEVDVNLGQPLEGCTSPVAVAVNESGARGFRLIHQHAVRAAGAGRCGHGHCVGGPLRRGVDVLDGGGAIPVSDGLDARSVAPIDHHAGVAGGQGGEFKGERSGRGGHARNAAEPVGRGGGGRQGGDHFRARELRALGRGVDWASEKADQNQTENPHAQGHGKEYGGRGAGVAGNHTLKVPDRNARESGLSGTCSP